MAQTNPVYFAYYDSTNTLVDLTSAVNIQEYGLNRERVYQTWTDGNWIEHRDVVRTRIQGEVSVGFRIEADYRAFLTALAAARGTDGTVKLKAYVNNVESVCEFYAFVDTAGAGRWDLLNSRQWQTLRLTVYER